VGMNDTGEQLAVAIEECIRLENELKTAEDHGRSLGNLLVLALTNAGGSLTITDQALITGPPNAYIRIERDLAMRTTRIWVEQPCTCHQTPPEMHTRYGSAVEPGSTLEPNPDCVEHFPRDPADNAGSEQALAAERERVAVHLESIRWEPGKGNNPQPNAYRHRAAAAAVRRMPPTAPPEPTPDAGKSEIDAEGADHAGNVESTPAGEGEPHAREWWENRRCVICLEPAIWLGVEARWIHRTVPKAYHAAAVDR
jgi:hypothetical protein